MHSTEPTSIESLWAAQHAVAPYPAGVVPVTEMIEGTAFFPGGRGLWRPDPDHVGCEVLARGVMILGHDFHSEAGYQASLARRGESMQQPTWRTLLRILDEVKIVPETCFFTNFYIGLRQGTQTTGVFPGARDPEYQRRCLAFLRTQLATYQPRIILTLGRFVPPLIAGLSPDLAHWAGSPSLKRIDAVGPLAVGVEVELAVGTLHTTIGALTHPSLRHLSVASRRYQGQHGEAAEHGIVADACRTIPVYSAPRCEL